MRKQQPRAWGRRSEHSLGGAMVHAPQPGVAAQLWQQSASDMVATTKSRPAQPKCTARRIHQVRMGCIDIRCNHALRVWQLGG